MFHQFDDKINVENHETVYEQAKQFCAAAVTRAAVIELIWMFCDIGRI
jgi:hypothetical protein